MQSTIKIQPEIRNVILFNELADRLLYTPDHLTPLGVFYGFSGLGKTRSAILTANMHRALYLEVGASWNLKQFCRNLMVELGATGGKTVPDMVPAIIEALNDKKRLLIIDEFDHIANLGTRSVNIVREILDKTRCPIILIGEEFLPTKIEKWERFDNRVRSWVKAQAIGLNDAKKLLALYAPDIEVEDNVMQRLVNEAQGVTRRICTGIESLREFANTTGVETITLDMWHNRAFFEQRPRPRRSVTDA